MPNFFRSVIFQLRFQHIVNPSISYSSELQVLKSVKNLRYVRITDFESCSNLSQSRAAQPITSIRLRTQCEMRLIKILALHRPIEFLCYGFRKSAWSRANYEPAEESWKYVVLWKIFHAETRSCYLFVSSLAANKLVLFPVSSDSWKTPTYKRYFLFHEKYHYNSRTGWYS